VPAGQRFDCSAVGVSEVQGNSKPMVSKRSQSQVSRDAAATEAKGRSIAPGSAGSARQKMAAFG